MEQDKATVLAVWLAMGGENDTLRRHNRDDTLTLCSRDEPSDDVSEWLGVHVEGGSRICLGMSRA